MSVTAGNNFKKNGKGWVQAGLQEPLRTSLSLWAPGSRGAVHGPLCWTVGLTISQLLAGAQQAGSSFWLGLPWLPVLSPWLSESAWSLSHPAWGPAESLQRNHVNNSEPQPPSPQEGWERS